MEKLKVGMYWHCHHDKLCEYVWDYDERVKVIKRKPENEVKTRLKLFKKIKVKLPEKYMGAGEKYDEAWKKYGETWEKYDEVREKYKPEIEKLHAKECGCKEWNGEEIVF